MMVPAIATQAVRHHHQRIGFRPQPGVFLQGQHPSAKAGNRGVLKRRVKTRTPTSTSATWVTMRRIPMLWSLFFALNPELQMTKPSIQK
jgi:hypothetical protein